MKVLFVVNPISGGVNKEPFLTEAKSICETYGINYKIFKTTGNKDRENLQKIIESYQPDRVASVGGDGTTLFTSTVLLGSELPMGIIPLGSANGMAAELGVNTNPIEAFKDLLISEIIKTLDVLIVNNEYYSIHIGDVGVNAQIVQSYENDSNRGMATYAKYFIEELSKLNPFPVSVKTSNENIQSNALMVGICNSRKYGTGVPLNKGGNPMDGKFEIVLIEKINAKSLIKAGLSKFNDNLIDESSIQVLSTDSAKIEFDTPRLLQLDGEVIGNFKEIDIKLASGGVQFITHAGNPYIG